MTKIWKGIVFFMCLFAFAFSLSFSFAQQAAATAICCWDQGPCHAQDGTWKKVGGIFYCSCVDDGTPSCTFMCGDC